MDKTTLDKLKRLTLLEPAKENEAEIRELVCSILSCCEKPADIEAKRMCLCKLRALSNEKCIAAKECDYGVLDLSELLRSVCLCADILLSGSGYKVTAELEPVLCAVCPTVIIDGFLNLISNAARFGKSREIYVLLKGCGGFASVKVINDGELQFDCCKPKKGIKAAENAARLHGGTLLYGSDRKTVTAGFSVSSRLRQSRRYDMPLFSDLLTDEFSAVHIGLSDVGDHNSIFL